MDIFDPTLLDLVVAAGWDDAAVALRDPAGSASPVRVAATVRRAPAAVRPGPPASEPPWGEVHVGGARGSSKWSFRTAGGAVFLEVEVASCMGERDTLVRFVDPQRGGVTGELCDVDLAELVFTADGPLVAHFVPRDTPRTPGMVTFAEATAGRRFRVVRR